MPSLAPPSATRLRRALGDPSERRPNPKAAARQEDRWRLLHRHVEGGVWTLLAQAPSREAIQEEMLGGWRALAPRTAEAGDPVRLEGPYAARDGLLGLAGDFLPLPRMAGRWDFEDGEWDSLAWARDLTWVEAWETCHRGGWMLWAVRKVLARERLVAAALAAVQAALPRGLGFGGEVYPPGLELVQAALASPRRSARMDRDLRALAGVVQADPGPWFEERAAAPFDPDDPISAANAAVGDLARALLYGPGWAAHAPMGAALAAGEVAGLEAPDAPDEGETPEEEGARREIFYSLYGQGKRTAHALAADAVRATVPLGELLWALSRVEGA